MSRRATSLVVLTGFVALATGLLVAQAPQEAIKSASDLPAFTYSISGSQDDLIRSEAAFRPLAERLRPDIGSLLRDYSIEDRPSLRGFHGTLLALDLLDNRTEEARKDAFATSAGSAQLPRDRTLPPFDFARWARFIVRDFFVVQPYEKVVIMADPSYYPEFLDAIRAELLEAKAIELGTMLFDSEAMFARRRMVRPRASDPEFKKQSTAAARALYEKADIFLWLPYRYGIGSEPGDRRPLEHLVEGTHARGLHFHWIQARLIPQEDVDSLSAIYAAALDIDYAALSAHQDRAIGVLKGREMRITTPLGTDLRVQVRQDSWFHKDDGHMDRARAAAARAVRDREMELPAGALRFVPDIGTTEGRLVVDRLGGGLGQVVTFTFAQGRIVSVTAKTGQDAVAAAWARETGDKDRLAELVLGMNPKLPHEGPGGQPPYYGYGAGILRIALGDNWESGGVNRSSLEGAAWFYLTDATITAGGVALVKDGKLVLP